MGNSKTHTLITIVGPTAIGKTSLSIELAKYFDTEIISADSRQFFKEMTIGTAKPSLEEQNHITHHFIDFISIHDHFTAGKFEKEALAILDQLFTKNNIVVLVGGSGLYINALLDGIDNIPKNESIREELTQKLNTHGINSLQKMIIDLDPDFAKEMNLENPQRLIRAIEVCLHTGKKYSELRTNQKKERPFNIIKIGLSAPREIMYDRINQRVDIMLNLGLLDEAKALYPHKQLNALQTVGYRELFGFFNEEYSLEFAISEIKKNTRRFAKRQVTWNKKDAEINWFDYTENPEIIIKRIKELIS